MHTTHFYFVRSAPDYSQCLHVYSFIILETFLVCSNTVAGRKAQSVRVCSSPGRHRVLQEARNAYMLFAGWEGRIVKNCDRGHSFSLYGPTLSRQISYLFLSCDKLALRNFELVTLLLNWLTCRLQTIAKNLTSEGASNSDTRQEKMY